MPDGAPLNHSTIKLLDLIPKDLELQSFHDKLPLAKREARLCLDAMEDVASGV